MTSRFRMTGATAAILAVAVLTSCATGVGVPRGNDTGQAGDAGAMIVPGVTAEDWVTYGDHVLLLTAVSENEVPATQDEIDAGEGIIGREVVLKVEEVLWSRADAPQAPETVTFSWGGWSFREGEENQPIEYADGVSLDVGQTYVAPVFLVQDPGAEPHWDALLYQNVWPADGGVIGQGDEVRTDDGVYSPHGDGDPLHELRDEVWGQGLAALVAVLESTAPDPAAVEFMDLPAQERHDAVQAAEGD